MLYSLQGYIIKLSACIYTNQLQQAHTIYAIHLMVTLIWQFGKFIFICLITMYALSTLVRMHDFRMWSG